MAYTIQQRRDTKENWEKVNPVLADAEIGFIKDLDENLKQKSSLFKIGNGKTAWNDLPLFGWGGTFYNAESAWRGSDLDTSIASQQAVLDKIAEKILASETTTNTTIEEVRAALEESFNASITELDKKYDEIINGTAEYTDEDSGEVIPATPGIEGRLANTEGKIDILLGDNTVEGSIDNRVKDAVDSAVSGILDGVSIDFDTLKEVETYITSDKAAMKSLNELTEGHTATLESHTASIEKHEKDIYGWDESSGEEVIRHKGFDEKIKDVVDSVDALDKKHIIITEDEYNQMKNTLSELPEGTLIFTFKEE